MMAVATECFLTQHYHRKFSTCEWWEDFVTRCLFWLCNLQSWRKTAAIHANYFWGSRGCSNSSESNATHSVPKLLLPYTAASNQKYNANHLVPEFLMLNPDAFILSYAWLAAQCSLRTAQSASSQQRSFCWSPASARSSVQNKQVPQSTLLASSNRVHTINLLASPFRELARVAIHFFQQITFQRARQSRLSNL